MSWIAAAVAAVGAGATIYGANKQASAVKDANATNSQLQADQNQSAWNAYLLSRGVNPAGAATGTLPSNPQAVNTKLPLWASASFPTGPTVWRKKGAGLPAATVPGSVPVTTAPSATVPVTQRYPWMIKNPGFQAALA